MAVETKRINMLAEAANWPEAITLIVFIVCFASVMLGNWPWQRDIYHDCDCNKDEDDDE